MALTPASSRSGIPSGWTQNATTGEVTPSSLTVAGIPLYIAGIAGQGVADGRTLLNIDNWDGNIVLRSKSGGGLRFGIAGSAEGHQVLGAELSVETVRVGFFAAPPVVQQASIADPTGGALIDTQSRTAIGLILDTLDAYGLTA